MINRTFAIGLLAGGLAATVMTKAAFSVTSSECPSNTGSERLSNIVDSIFSSFEDTLNEEVKRLINNNELSKNFYEALGQGLFVSKDTERQGLTYTACVNNRNMTDEERIRCLTSGFLNSFQHAGQLLGSKVQNIKSPQDYAKVVDGFTAKLLDDNSNLNIFAQPARSYSYVHYPYPTADVYYASPEIKNLYNSFLMNQALRDSMINAFAKEYSVYLNKSKEIAQQQEQISKNAINQVNCLENALNAVVSDIINSIPSISSGIGPIDAIINMVRTAAIATVQAQLNIGKTQLKAVQSTAQAEMSKDIAENAKEVKKDEIDAKYKIATLSMLSTLVSNSEMDYIRNEAAAKSLKDYYEIKKELKRKVD